MARVLIVADDLSGAADCGIACVRAGLKARVSLGGPRDDWAHVDVLSLDAHTRELTAEAAADRMLHFVQQYAPDRKMLLFKKIDSTLRGHLGAELASVLEARRAMVPDAIAIMAPAFPANGRTTVAGMHYIHGTALHESEMWKKEGIQGQAQISQMLDGFGLRIEHLDLVTVRSSRETINSVAYKLAKSNDVLVCDAETATDLASIAEMAADFGDRAVWVGSAGLAQHLAKAVGLTGSEGVEPPVLPQISGSVLFVIGSASRTTRHQVDVLLSSAAIHGIVVPPDVLLAGPNGPSWSAFTKELCDSIEQGEDVILMCDSKPQVAATDRPRLSDALGEMTANLRGRVGAVVASGGETARKVLNGWGVQAMELYGELETGVPIATATVPGSRPFTVITKAGDFGQLNTLLHCLEWLNQTRVSE